MHSIIPCIDNTHYVKKSSNWEPTETDWQILPMSTGTGTLRWKRTGSLIEIRLHATAGTLPTGATWIASNALPVNVRADQNIRGTGVFSSSNQVLLITTAAGSIGV